MIEEEAWAEALILHRTLGAQASTHVAERIAILARVGDVAGVSRWREIASRVDELGSAAVDPRPAQAFPDGNQP
ncbi:DUF6961 family protein [Sphingomonas paucimobilis]|uniref:DUF6961 family protein n=1 Tax=Sphingomonas paucimobilis TaxID=13689 RepID=UPI0030FBAA01